LRNFHVILAAVAVALLVGGCSSRQDEARKRISAEYDQKTGRLKLLKYDSNGNGVVDTWSYMDGARFVRIEIDKDEDGKIDRWEYYGADQKLEKVGFSRQNDGKEDAWQYLAPDGSVTRVEISGRRDGKISRIEHYEQGHLVSAEEDGDGDGRMDMWQTYEPDGRLASAAFDTKHRGTPDRRLIYGSDGSARLEVDTAGDGHFVAVNQPSPKSLPNPESRIPNPK
jgi:hypothetical protein